jgi:hypothetical protein
MVYKRMNIENEYARWFTVKLRCVQPFHSFSELEFRHECSPALIITSLKTYTFCLQDTEEMGKSQTRDLLSNFQILYGLPLVSIISHHCLKELKGTNQKFTILNSCIVFHLH